MERAPANVSEPRDPTKRILKRSLTPGAGVAIVRCAMGGRHRAADVAAKVPATAQRKRPAPCGAGLAAKERGGAVQATGALLLLLPLRGFTAAGLVGTGAGCGAAPEITGAAGA